MIFCEFTHSALGDDVGGLRFTLRSGGGAEHLEQLLDSVLQQPVNQSLQHRQLRGTQKVKLWQREGNGNGCSLTLKNSVGAHLDAVGFEHHFDVLKERKEAGGDKNPKLLHEHHRNVSSKEEITYIHLHLNGFSMRSSVALQEH